MKQIESGWEEQEGRLQRDFTFADFATAMRFVGLVAQAAEAQDHHPQWSNLGATVQIQLWSHDVDGITARDHRLAKCCDQLALDVVAQTVCQFAVTYRWRLHPGAEESFRQAWAEVTHHIASVCGGLGSRLHLAEDGTYLAYAQWPSRELWQAAQQAAPLPPDHPVRKSQEQMRAAVAETLPTTTMNVVEDLLKARFLGWRGD